MAEQGTAPAGTPDSGSAAPSGPSLGDQVGMLLGDFPLSIDYDDTPSSESDGSPASPTGSTAGQPSGAITVDDDGTELAPEGTDDAEHAETPAGAATDPALDPAVAAPDLAFDPEKSEPLAYRTDGQSKAFDGIRVYKDASGKYLGGTLDPDAIPEVEKAFSERDHYKGANRTLYDATQRYEKLTEWVTQDAQGQPKTLTGDEAVLASRTALGTLAARDRAFTELFNDPSRLAALLDFQPTDDQGNGKYVWKQERIELFKERLENAMIGARQQVRDAFGTLTSSVASTAAQPSAEQVTARNAASVDVVAQQLGISGLDAADKTTLAKAIQPYIRLATREDIAANPALSPTDSVVDPAFAEVMKHIHGLRSSTTKQVTTATDASRKATAAAISNAKKVAAANAGRRPAPVNSSRQPAPNTPTAAQEREQARREQWEQNERALATAL